MKTQFVHYGCGLCAPSTWQNFDVSPTLRLQRIPVIGAYFRKKPNPTFPDNVLYGDIVKGLSIAKGSCSAIYCSHVLEHLALEDLRVALLNTYSYLQPGGIFRFVIPDLEQLAREYVQSSDPEAAYQFMEASCLGKRIRVRGMKGALREILGNSTHLWMWDFKAITLELQKAGFREIRRAYFGDSKQSRFQEVEEYGRWKDCLGVECIR